MRKAWKEYWAVKRNRIAFFILAGSCLYLILLYLPDGGAVPEASLPRGGDSSGARREASLPEAKQPLEHVASGTSKAVKDPFALPKALRVPPPQEPELQLFRENSKSDNGRRLVEETSISPVKSPVKLTGIVSGAHKKIAILSYRSERKQCLVNERIGPYRVAGIDGETVILSGPSGSFNLTVGR